MRGAACSSGSTGQQQARRRAVASCTSCTSRRSLPPVCLCLSCGGAPVRGATGSGCLRFQPPMSTSILEWGFCQWLVLSDFLTRKKSIGLVILKTFVLPPNPSCTLWPASEADRVWWWDSWWYWFSIFDPKQSFHLGFPQQSQHNHLENYPPPLPNAELWSTENRIWALRFDLSKKIKFLQKYDPIGSSYPNFSSLLKKFKLMFLVVLMSKNWAILNHWLIICTWGRTDNKTARTYLCITHNV